MPEAELLALSPLDGRYAARLEAFRPMFAEYGLIRARVFVEVEWLLTLADVDGIAELPAFPDSVRTRLRKIASGFSITDAMRIKQIERITNHDVKAIEYFLKERLKDDAELSRALEFVHFACTSEDINNLAYALMLSQARQIFLLPQLDELIQTLRDMAHAHADVAMLSRTHGQPASPTTIGKELANTVARLQRQGEQLASVALTGKINGAVGNYNAHVVSYPDVDWPALAKHFVESLGLEFAPYTTQIEPHDCIAELCDAQKRANTICVDLCRDLWGYISLGYFRQMVKDDEVGSSTMPHKVNPIDFENAEGNFGIANALLEHFAAKLPTSRWQRDLTDSTVLRTLGTGFGHGLVGIDALLRGLDKLSVNYECVSNDLEAEWEVLSEAVQTVMRRHGLPDPYEQLKALTRGRRIDPRSMQDFITSTDLPAEAKQRLLQMTPASYIGLAEQLARAI